MATFKITVSKLNDSTKIRKIKWTRQILKPINDLSNEKSTAPSPKIVLIGRFHVDMFYINKLIPPGIDVAIKFIPHDDQFLFMSADADHLGPKVVIKKMNIIVAIKQMLDATDLAHRVLVRERNMRLTYTRVMMKHVAIPAGSLTMCLEIIFTGGQPELVVMGFVSDTAFAGNYTENPFNVKNFKIKQIDLFLNGMPVPRFGYQPNFTENI